MKSIRPFALALLAAALGSFSSVGAQTPTGTPPPATNAQLFEQAGWILAMRSQVGDLNLSATELACLQRGIAAAAANRPPLLDPAQAGPQLEQLIGGRLAAKKAVAVQAGKAAADRLFAGLKHNPRVVALPSGLCYEILRPGTGAFPKATDVVEVHYTGTLPNGHVFDSSISRGQPAKFSLNQVIRGWTEGVQKISVGGKIRLYVPAALAYGDNPPGGIPPASALLFDVELLRIAAK